MNADIGIYIKIGTLRRFVKDLSTIRRRRAPEEAQKAGCPFRPGTTLFFSLLLVMAILCNESVGVGLLGRMMIGRPTTTNRGPSRRNTQQKMVECF